MRRSQRDNFTSDFLLLLLLLRHGLGHRFRVSACGMNA